MSFVLAVSIRIKPDQVDNFMKRALENGKAARTTKPGCKQFDILGDLNDKMRVMLTRSNRREGLRGAPADAALQEVPGRERATARLARADGVGSVPRVVVLPKRVRHRHHQHFPAQ